MTNDRNCIMNLSYEGYGLVRKVGNVGVTTSKGFFSNDEFSKLLDKIIDDPDVRANL